MDLEAVEETAFLVQEDLEALEVPLEVVQEVELVHQVPLKKLFLEFQALTTQSLLRFLPPPFCVMDKLMEDTMLILKQIAKLSIFVQMMEKVD